MSPANTRPRRGFTLIELLIVVGIIVLLITIAVAVGASVVGGGKRTQTESVLRALDVTLNDFTAHFGKIPPPTVEDPHAAGRLMPIADARNMVVNDADVSRPGYQMINSVGLYLLQLESLGASTSAIQSLDATFVRRYSAYSERNAEGDNVVHEITTVLDAWGNPIRYVHPAFGGLLYPPLENPDPRDRASAAQSIRVQDVLGQPPAGFTYAIEAIRRNALQTEDPPQQAHHFADSDGGISANQRPYFYSAGPDGDPATIDDNVYTTRPQFLNTGT